MSICGARIEATALALLLGGCAGCGGEPALAELVEHRGAVEREARELPNRWSAAEDGDELRAGDGLRTLSGASAVLELAGGRLRLEERTVIRLALEDRGIEIASGQAVLEADQRLELHTSAGDAVFEPGARASLRDGDLEVLFGRVVVGEEELVAGESLSVRIGGAELETPRSADHARLWVKGAARLRHAGEPSWRALAEGQSAAPPGTRVALDAGARVAVRRGASRIAITGPTELGIGGPGGPLVTTGAGYARIDARGEEVALEAPGVRIIARADGRAEVRIDGAETRVRALEGRVEVLHAGARRSLEPGQELALARPPPPAPLGPSRAHLAADAGESFTVHGSRAPIVVELAVAHCPHEAVIAASGQRTRGAGRVSIGLPFGRHSYEVRCRAADGSLSAEPVASGRIHVRRDDGSGGLPEVPPSAHVIIDGRPYTVLFQGVLPRVVVSWPGAGGRAPYTLVIARGDDTRERASAAPRFELPPGTVLEGVYVLRARDASGATSRSARVTIALDEATPTASIEAPEDGAFAPGRAVRVAGVAQRGWVADVDGRALALDPRRRFEGDAIVAADRDALAIRLRHPRRGVHYYLRFAR